LTPGADAESEPVRTSAEPSARIVYVTARLPYGAGEPFVVPEIDELERQGCRVTVVPIRPGGDVVHDDGRHLLARTAAVPVISSEVLRTALAEVARDPRAAAGAVGLLRESRGGRILLKNLAVVPKAFWLARLARREGAEHVHAHWAGTSATLAMLAARLAGIPWSLTAHRWDIAERNLLRQKSRDACFVRAISEHGAAELRQAVGLEDWSPWVLHMGVRLPPRGEVPPLEDGPLRVLTPARFVEKKGHVHLLAAAQRLEERGTSVRFDLAGEGPLGEDLRARAAGLGLRTVSFIGQISHEELLRDLAAGRWHAVVLPSVVTASGGLEGIPVSLIEALACGLPVVGTDTGGIPELLGGGAGLLVPPGDPEALAGTLERLAGDEALRGALGRQGRARVEGEYALETVAAALLGRFRDCAGSA
jgi:glycosyltransferase involved in cell wall biosynthesis